MLPYIHRKEGHATFFRQGIVRTDGIRNLRDNKKKHTINRSREFTYLLIIIVVCILPIENNMCRNARKATEKQWRPTQVDNIHAYIHWLSVSSTHNTPSIPKGLKPATPIQIQTPLRPCSRTLCGNYRIHRSPYQLQPPVCHLACLHRSVSWTSNRSRD